MEKPLWTHSYVPEVARNELAKMIALHEYPISIVEHEGFRNYSKALQPLFNPLSRNTLRSDIFKIYDVERAKTMNLLENNRSKIAITTD